MRMLVPIPVAILMALAAYGAAAQDRQEVALQAAIRTEVIDGNLAGAIEQYEAIAKGSNRTAAAQALLRIGRCRDRLGDSGAAEAYSRLVKEFGDQKATAQEAADRLAHIQKERDRQHTLGWYNGDWQSGLPGFANWYRSAREYARVYDDFVVPTPGWSVFAVFSNSRMDPVEVTSASWEIRSGMSPGNRGRLIASGVSPAKQTVVPGNGPFPRDPKIGYRIEVDNLHVNLAPGRYWLSVAPVGRLASHLSATRGRNAVGDPKGANGLAFVDSPLTGFSIVEAASIGGRGSLGVATDFSQGVIVR